jgi:hypothetical protein
MTIKKPFNGLFISNLTWAIFGSCIGCGLYESRYLTYRKTSPQIKGQEEACAIEIAAFIIYLTPMIKERCTNSCHIAGGTAERQLKFTGHAEKDAENLKKQEDRTAIGIYRKAAGIVAHGGGKAALASDQERFEKWFAAARLCPRQSSH